MHRSLSTAVLAWLVVGCDRAPDATAPPALSHGSHFVASVRDNELRRGAIPSPEVVRDLARLRSLTAPFHRFGAASAAGWSTPIPGCFSDPTQGGMGFHFGNDVLIDGEVDVLEPELLVYEPRRNGELRLVAVEYIVPFTAWTSPQPPRLFDQFFHRNEAFGIWVLHVWHFRHNPSGMFVDWNPDVSCEFAGS